MYAFRAIHFPLSTAFTASYKLWYAVISFQFVSSIFWFSLWFFFFDPLVVLECVVLIYPYLWIFQFSFCYWFLEYFHCGQRKYFVWLLSFKIYWDLFCSLIYGLSWRIFHVHLRRMCILLLLDGVFCMSVRCIWVILLFKSSISLLIICLDVLSIIESRVLKSPTIIVELFLSSVLSVIVSYIWGLFCLCTYVCNCYISLMNWPFYQYIMSFFVS